jgi:putative transposase
MKTVLHPWQMLLVILAGWINQQHAIEYLIAENRILREKKGKKRILLTDDQRRRLAVKGKVLGKNELAEICGIFTPETILHWHRELIAKKWDYSKCRKKVGRPRMEKEVAELVWIGRISCLVDYKSCLVPVLTSLKLPLQLLIRSIT